MDLILGIVSFFAVLGLIVFLVLWAQERRNAEEKVAAADKVQQQAEARVREVLAEAHKLKALNARLAKWTSVADADAKAAELLREAQSVLQQAEHDAAVLTSNADHNYAQIVEKAQQEAARATSEARATAKSMTDSATESLTAATRRAAEIIADANTKAEEIAGKAFDAVRNAERYERTARAMKNLIDGYGDEYLKPVASLLDGLAE